MMFRNHLIGVCRLAFVAGAVFFFVAGGLPNGPTAGAVDGTAGPVAVTVVRTPDGQGVSVHAEAPGGVLIYEIAAHLCIHDSGVRTMFDFGFQGKKCTSAPVGGSDVEQKVNYATGSAVADLPLFRISEGSVHWFNSAGFEQEISCGPGLPCDVVVQLQITNADVRFPAAVCFDATCPAGTVGETPPPAPAASSVSADGANAAPAGVDSDAATTAPGGTGTKNGSGGASSTKSDTSAAGSSSSSDVDPDGRPLATGITLSTDDGGPSRSTRVQIAAVAGVAGGALIAGLVGRGRRQMSEAGMYR